jgi:ribosomal protein S18 acetylase RimI-like enzyme
MRRADPKCSGRLFRVPLDAISVRGCDGSAIGWDTSRIGLTSDNMDLEFRKAVLPDELTDLVAFDAEMFSNPGDYMGPDVWINVEAYWMLADKVKVGCCALEHSLDYDDAPKEGYLYIASIAIVADRRIQGLGTRFTEWQIEYGRRRGFSTIVANTRESNLAMKGLYKKLGFKVRCITDYYDEPEERTVVFDLVL